MKSAYELAMERLQKKDGAPVALTGLVPLNGSLDHWAEGTMSVALGIAQEAAMDPTLVNGTRKYFTDLDYAAMADIGWEVNVPPPVPEASTWAMLMAGLGLVAVAVRRRKTG